MTMLEKKLKKLGYDPKDVAALCKDEKLLEGLLRVIRGHASINIRESYNDDGRGYCNGVGD